MRRMLAATLLAATAALTVPASAEDCVTNYLRLEDDDGSAFVEVNRDDLSVHVYPSRAVDDAARLVIRTNALVDCVV